MDTTAQRQQRNDPASKDRPSLNDKPKMPTGKIWLWFLVILVLNYIISKTFFSETAQAVNIPYTVFKAEVLKNNVKAIDTRWGMSEKIGMIELAPRQNPYLESGTEGFMGARPFSEETARKIDEEVLKIINDLHQQAKDLLVKYRKELDALAHALLEHETLDEQEILKVTGLVHTSKQQH